MGHQRCCCGDVLIWLASQDPMAPFPVDITDYEDLIAVYEDMGLTVHSDLDWTGNIADYSLVFVDTPYAAPSWWATATGGGWTGRIHLIGEYFPGGMTTDVTTWINSVTGTTGLTLIEDNIDSGASLSNGSIETDDLTDGLTTALLYSATSRVSGGTVLSKTATGSENWIAHNKVGTVDYVLSGDSNHLVDDMGAGAAITPGSDNELFAQNLYTVAV